MTAPFFTEGIFFRRSGPGGGRFAGACRRGYFLGQSQSRAPSPAKRVSSSFLLAFGGEKSPIGDSQYGSPPGRSFYSCKRNQNMLGALPQDPDAPERPPGKPKGGFPERGLNGAYKVSQMHLPPPGLPRFGGGERPPFFCKPIAPLTITMGRRPGSLRVTD